MVFEMVKGRTRKAIAKLIEELLKGELECR